MGTFISDVAIAWSSAEDTGSSWEKSSGACTSTLPFERPLSSACPTTRPVVRIIAYLSARDPARPSIIEMKSFCARHLPSYMSPDVFQFLDSLAANLDRQDRLSGAHAFHARWHGRAAEIVNDDCHRICRPAERITAGPKRTPGDRALVPSGPPTSTCASFSSFLASWLSSSRCSIAFSSKARRLFAWRSSRPADLPFITFFHSVTGLPSSCCSRLRGIGVVLGLAEGAWLVGIGLAVIGIAHLPIPMLARLSILGAAGIGMALLRVGVGEVPWSSALWPILGSMFVFRLIIYLYDRSYETAPPRLSQTLGYFFMLPNVCFPLFPVVDFKKFCRNYYDEERHKIYQVGIEWIWRGLLHLILYRVVYYHLTIDPVAVAHLGDLVVYMVSTFLLYVRISGYFHLVVGMLHLFGFNLPETHHRYFLASSFTDFWRRINIYWKDFMMKVFYYPAFFRLRKLGETRALVLATAFTFLVTWFLHLVQWFWIRGSAAD